MIVQQAILRWDLIGSITTGDGKWPKRMDYPCEFVSVGGGIKTLGSGAGTSTDVQLRNATQAKDILSTVGAFEVDSGTRLLEAAVVNANNARCAAGDIVQLDVDTTSTGPADAVIEATVNLFMDDV